MHTVELVRQGLNPSSGDRGHPPHHVRRARQHRPPGGRARSAATSRTSSSRSVVPRNVRLSECPSFGKPILLYDIKSKGCESYLALGHEILRARPGPDATGGRPDDGSFDADPAPSDRSSEARAAAGALRADSPGLRAGAGRRSRAATGIVRLPVEPIQRDPSQPRKTFDEAKLRELAESIQDPGVIQPVLVRQRRRRTTASSPGSAAGGRRSWPDSRRSPRSSARSPTAEAFELALVENLQRADLNPIEEAEGYRRLVEEFGLTQEQVSERVGKDRSTVANALRLLPLPEEVKELLADGALDMGHARALLGMPPAPELVDRRAHRSASSSRSARPSGWSARPGIADRRPREGRTGSTAARARGGGAAAPSGDEGAARGSRRKGDARDRLLLVRGPGAYSRAAAAVSRGAQGTRAPLVARASSRASLPGHGTRKPDDFGAEAGGGERGGSRW